MYMYYTSEYYVHIHVHVYKYTSRDFKRGGGRMGRGEEKVC